MKHTFSLSFTFLEVIKEIILLLHFRILIFSNQPWPPEQNQCQEKTDEKSLLTLN
jgi:hypothetical protein